MQLNHQFNLRQLATLPLFDPKEGMTVKEPPGISEGYWVGAPSVLFDPESKKFYLYYRLRWPRGVGELDRGAECRIAESTDGLHFTDIWQAQKTDFPSPSVERGALVKTHQGRWRLYLGLVDTEDNRWRIDLLEADSPAEFDPQKRQCVLSADDIGGEAVKDPYIWHIGSTTFLYVSYAPKPESLPESQRDQLHTQADVFVTGLVKSHTGLAISQDGINFRWLGEVLASSHGSWDNYCARITSIVPGNPFFIAFYDGCRSVQENFNQRVGMAITTDFFHFHKLTVDQPVLHSPYGNGCVRYLDALVHDGKIYYYYEFARPDGAYELRVKVEELI
ncbi:MAG: hypothetical protein D6813_09405 [Calditrichaeota bacterium]|nr:MAG: hypothetical protein D6813_09405 [Calditrichota bacterium]